MLDLDRFIPIAAPRVPLIVHQKTICESSNGGYPTRPPAQVAGRAGPCGY